MASKGREIADLWWSGTPIVYLVTVEEAQAVALCHEAAGLYGARVAVWSSHRGLDPLATAAKDPRAALAAVAETPARLCVVLLDFHVWLADPRVERCVRDALPGLVLAGHRLAIVAPRLQLPHGLAADSVVIRLPLPGEASLGILLDSLATASGPDWSEARHRALLAARGLTISQAQRAFAKALDVDPELGPRAVEAILVEKKRLLASGIGLEIVETGERLEDIGGLEGFKSWMTERCQAFRANAREYGLPAPRGAILLGVQGCGKSLTAKAVAGELGVPLLRLDLARVFGAGGGATAEEGLARAVEAAEAMAPVVLWIDEIEKGFAGASSDTGDERTARLLGYFSTWLQERRSEVFVVATANDVGRLPPELLRRGRFDEIFFIDLPDPAAREAILAVHLRRRGRGPESYDLRFLSEQCADFSGAELEQVVVGALHHAFAQGRDLRDGDLRRNARDLVPLYRTYEETIKALREWARGRARSTGKEEAVLGLFRRVGT